MSIKNILIIWILFCVTVIATESSMWERIREGSTLGWSVYLTGQDPNDPTDYEKFVSVATMTNDTGEEEVWVAVQRTVDSNDYIYIEQFQPLDWYEDINDAWFVDCAGDERYVFHDEVEAVEGEIVYGDYTKYYLSYAEATGTGVITKVTTDSTVDTTWGTNGYWDDTGASSAIGLVTLDDGSILACVNMHSASDRIYKIDADGNTDTTWGTNGYYELSAADMSSGANSVLVDNSGNIHVFGGVSPVDLQSERTTYGSYYKLDSDGNFVSKLVSADSGLRAYSRAIWADDDKTRIIAIGDGSGLTINGQTFCTMVAIDPETGDVDTTWTGNIGSGGHAKFYYTAFVYHIVRTSDGKFICHQANAISHYKILADGSALDTAWATNGELTTGQTAYDSGDSVYMDIDSNDNVYAIVEISNQDWLYKIDSTGTVSATHNTELDVYHSLAYFNDIVHLFRSTSNHIELWSNSLVLQSGFDMAFNPDAGRSIIPDEYTREYTETIAVDACDAYWETIDVNYSRLEDRYMCIFADGNSQGSYLVSDANLTGIDSSDYDYFLAGLNYYSVYESFPLDVLENQRSRILRVAIDLQETYTLNLGLSIDNSSEISFNELFTGYKIAEFPRAESREPIIYLWGYDPLPFTIRGLYLNEEITIP